VDAPIAFRVYRIMEITKQPWEMTKGEYVDGHVRSPAMHNYAVQQALKEGKPVPLEVLKDYPDLVKAIPKVAPEMPDPDQALYFGEKEKLALSTIGNPETTGIPKYLYHASRKGALHKEGIEPSVAGVIRKDPEGAKVFMSSDPQGAVNSVLTEEALKRERGVVFSTKGDIVVYKIKLPEGSVTRDPRSGDYIIKRKVKPGEIVDFKLRGQKFHAT